MVDAKLGPLSYTDESILFFTDRDAGDLYRRPVSRFIDDFIGETNIIEEIVHAFEKRDPEAVPQSMREHVGGFAGNQA